MTTRARLMPGPSDYPRAWFPELRMRQSANPQEVKRRPRSAAEAYPAGWLPELRKRAALRDRPRRPVMHS
jgi:hypothetical protein